MTNFAQTGAYGFAAVEGERILKQTIAEPSLAFNYDLKFREMPNIASIFQEEEHFVVNLVKSNDFATNYRYKHSQLADALFHFPILGQSSEFLEMLHNRGLLQDNKRIILIQLGDSLNTQKLKMLDYRYDEETSTDYAYVSDLHSIYNQETVIGEYLTLACSSKGVICLHGEKILTIDVSRTEDIAANIEAIFYEIIKYNTAQEMHFALKAYSHALAVAGIKIVANEGNGAHRFSLKEVENTFNVDLEAHDITLGVNMDEEDIVVGDKQDATQQQDYALELNAISFKRKCRFHITGQELCTVEYKNSTYTLYQDQDDYYMATRSNIVIEGYHAYAEVSRFYAFNANCAGEELTIQLPLPVCLKMQEQLNLPVGALLCGKLPSNRKDIMYSSYAAIADDFFTGIIVVGEPLVIASNQYFNLGAFVHKDEINLVISVKKEQLLTSKRLYKTLINLLNIENPNRTGNHYSSPYICINSKLHKEFVPVIQLLTNPFISHDGDDEIEQAAMKILNFLNKHKQAEFRKIYDHS